TLRQLGVERLLDELEDEDPPHLEHAFVAREVKAQVAEHVSHLSRDVLQLRRQTARLQLVTYVMAAFLVCWLTGWFWGFLPGNVRSAITDEFVKKTVGLLFLIIP